MLDAISDVKAALVALDSALHTGSGDLQAEIDRIEAGAGLNTDGTYTANGYGTTSIVGDGGMIRLMVDQGILTPEQALEIIRKIKREAATEYGAYLVNYVYSYNTNAMGKDTHNRKIIKYLYKFKSYR